MNHHFLLRHLRRHDHHHHHHHLLRHHTTTPTSILSSITWVRDRALDHAVEKERDLKPILNLKSLITHQPSKTLPLNIISDHRSQLLLPTRPIDFIRKYPNIFHQYFPNNITTIHPHIKLTPETLTLDTEQQLLFQSESFKLDVANRLLKLLMLGRVNKIPVSVINCLKWDLGLPDDYVETVVPEFPDCFRVNGKDELELVCWSDELAVSVMDAKGATAFPVSYSRGFEVDNKFKKWVEDWQKLPYVSPYENASNLKDRTEESDKWVVGLLHEVLHLMVPKKTEKENLLVYGEFMGVRSRFKKALMEHPGIFYVSSKLRTHTVVLREGYKRDLLVEKVVHPVMKMRGSYIHLMNMVKEKSKSKSAEVGGDKKQKTLQDLDGEGEDMRENEEDDDEEDETEGVRESGSDNDVESDNVVGNDDGESEDLENGSTKIRGRTSGIVKFKDSHRRNTPNARASDNDGRRRGRGRDRKSAIDEKSDSRNNRVSDRRVRKETSPPSSSVNDDDNDDDDDDDDDDVGRRRGRGENRKYAVDGKSDSRTNWKSDRRDRRETNHSSSRVNGDFDGRRGGRGENRRYGFDGKSDSRTDWKSDRRDRMETNSRVNVDDDDGRRRRGRGESRKYGFDGKSDSRTNRMSDRRGTRETGPSRFLRTEAPGARASRGRSSERSSASRTREGRF